MSKGHAKHQESHHGLSSFGKDLVRRCGSKCELCDAQGVKLVVFEVPPIGTEPDYDHCVMICENCQSQIERPKTIKANYWRFLATTMWNTIPALKVISVAMLKHLSAEHAWAAELLDQVYLNAEEDAWVIKIVI